METQGEPVAGQPLMFGTRMQSEPLPWAWAVERLERARNYWIATTRPNGRPHTRPVWAVWLEGAVYFSTGSLAAQNLTVNSAITVHLESGDETVIIEGVAELVNDETLLKRVVDLYNQKYHWDMDTNQLPGPFYAVRSQLAFGWVSDPSGLDYGAAFHASVTRWRLPE